jgi:hypothetical protein
MSETELRVYLNDTYVGSGYPIQGGLTAILYDPSPLSEGARIGVGFGPAPITYLPERLHLMQQPSP